MTNAIIRGMQPVQEHIQPLLQFITHTTAPSHALYHQYCRGGAYPRPASHLHSYCVLLDMRVIYSFLRLGCVPEPELPIWMMGYLIWWDAFCLKQVYQVLHYCGRHD